MPKPPRATIQHERDVRAYAELWHASDCVLQAGLAEPHGSAWQFLSSTVLTAFAFEAYMNHVGEGSLGLWTADDRKPPLEKLELLCSTLELSFPGDYGQRPLQTVKKLVRFRNALAHGRSTKLAPKSLKVDVRSDLDQRLWARPLTDWEGLIQTPAFARRAREDVEAVLQKLHDKLPEPKEPLFAFGTHVSSASLAGE